MSELKVKDNSYLIFDNTRTLAITPAENIELGKEYRKMEYEDFVAAQVLYNLGKLKGTVFDVDLLSRAKKVINFLGGKSLSDCEIYYAEKQPLVMMYEDSVAVLVAPMVGIG